MVVMPLPIDNYINEEAAATPLTPGSRMGKKFLEKSDCRLAK